MNRSRLFCSFPMTCEYGSWEGNTSKKPDVNRSHEPVGIPLNRPPGTFSPTGGKKDGMRGYGSWGGWLYTSRVRGVTRTARRVADRKTNSGNRLCSNARKPLQRARPHPGPLPQEREGASEAF